MSLLYLLLLQWVVFASLRRLIVKRQRILPPNLSCYFKKALCVGSKIVFFLISFLIFLLLLFFVVYYTHTASLLLTARNHNVLKIVRYFSLLPLTILINESAKDQISVLRWNVPALILVRSYYEYKCQKMFF